MQTESAQPGSPIQEESGEVDRRHHRSRAANRVATTTSEFTCIFFNLKKTSDIWSEVALYYKAVVNSSCRSKVGVQVAFVTMRAIQGN